MRHPGKKATQFGYATIMTALLVVAMPVGLTEGPSSPSDCLRRLFDPSVAPDSSIVECLLASVGTAPNCYGARILIQLTREVLGGGGLVADDRNEDYGYFEPAIAEDGLEGNFSYWMTGTSRDASCD